MVRMYDKKQSKTIAFENLLKTKIPVNYLFTGIFYYLLIVSNRLLFHGFKICSGIIAFDGFILEMLDKIVS